MYLLFSSFRGGVLLLLCLMVEKSAGVNCGEALRACKISGLLLLLDGNPLSPTEPRIRFMAFEFESSADGAELLRSRRIMAAAAMLRLKSCEEAEGICGDGGEGPAELRENNEVSSCIDGLRGVRIPELSKF